jgi:hypothetical protein
MSRFLVSFVITALLSACSVNPSKVDLVQERPDPNSVTVKFDPKVGMDGGVSAQGIDINLCTFTLNYPHQSGYNPTEVKADAIGQCPPSSEPFLLTAFLELERNQGGAWTKVATGPRIRKEVGAAGATWRQYELVVVDTCRDGVYRSKLNIEAVNPSGGVIAVPLARRYSSVRNVQCKPRAVSLVVDDTGSMDSVIGAVKASLTGYINGIPEDEYTLWNLITFKDDVSVRGTTTNRSTILGWVGSLYAWGGDDCPENVLGGISSGIWALLPYVDHTRDLVVITDASSQPGDVSGILAAAKLNNVRVSVLLSGDCGLPPASVSSRAGIGVRSVSTTALSSQVVLKRIAEETGGKYFYLPGGSQPDFEHALGEIFNNIRDTDPPTVDREPPSVTMNVTPSTLWPPNHKLVEVKLAVSVSDNLDPTPRVELVGVKVSEPDDGQGDGNTDDDVQITADGRIFVRAERSAQGNRRVYTITYRATDASGNIGYGSADVVVPHDRSGK